MNQVYPFGSPLKRVEQKDKSPKEVFVLGAYASSILAKWIDVKGNIKAVALPVASEPSIFWDGEKPGQILKGIKIPPELGKLIPVDEEFNGPSGKILGKLYLLPLGYHMKDVWLCNLLPYSRLNPNQKKEIEVNYNPLVEAYNLPECTILNFNESELVNQSRMDEILAELLQSQADTIILLGDLTIKHFLSHFCKFKSLSDFGNSLRGYGKTRRIEIAGRLYNVIPLTHPRSDEEFINDDFEWRKCHSEWYLKKIPILMKKYNKWMKELRSEN